MKYLVGGLPGSLVAKKEKAAFALCNIFRLCCAYKTNKDCSFRLQTANRGVGVCFPLLRLCVDVEGISTYTYLIAKEYIYFKYPGVPEGGPEANNTSGNRTVEAPLPAQSIGPSPIFLESAVWLRSVVQMCAGIWCCNRNNPERIWIPDEGMFMELAAYSDTV